MLGRGRKRVRFRIGTKEKIVETKKKTKKIVYT